MATILKEQNRIPSLPIDIPLAPVSSLAKPQRPKSKSLQPCRCPKEGCGKMFSKRSNLKAHMRVHSGVLPYPCEFPGCTKRFRWKSSLKPHIKVHLASGHLPGTSPCTSATVSSRLVSSPVPQKPFEPSTPATKPVFRATELELPPQRVLSELSPVDGSSPSAIIDTSLFDSPVTPESNTRQYNCYFAGCNAKYPRMSMLLEHEESSHRGNRPQVVRALFQDSHSNPTDYTEQGEIDLSCNSVLSSQDSRETDVISFTLDSPLEDVSNPLEASPITEDLWKADVTVVDPFMDFPVNLGATGKVMDLLTSSDGNSGISESNNTDLGLSEPQWMIQGGSSSSSSAEFPSLYLP